MSRDTIPDPGESATLVIPGEVGAIEARIDMPAAQPRGVAVICHPHPLYGGAMTNKVTYMLAATARQAGFAAVRFNFRGVGATEGTHDDGSGETRDLTAVVDWVREQIDGPLVLGGFSFGAGVALRAAADLAPDALVTVAPPLFYFDDTGLPAAPDCPWLVMHARDDDVVAYGETMQRLQAYDPPPVVVTFDAAGHFFHGKVNQLRDHLADFLAQHAG